MGGKSTVVGEGETPLKQTPKSRKRLFSEDEEVSLDTTHLRTSIGDDRFSESMMARHNDRHKDRITLKRAPLNFEIIEELE